MQNKYILILKIILKIRMYHNTVLHSELYPEFLAIFGYLHLTQILRLLIKSQLQQVDVF